MNRRTIRHLALAFVMVAVSVTARAQSHLSPQRLGFGRADIPATVEAQLLVDRLRVALEQRDTAMLADLLAPDFLELESTQKISRMASVVTRDAMLAAPALFLRPEAGKPSLHFKWNTVAENNAELQINLQARRSLSGGAAIDREIFLRIARSGQRWRIVESAGLYDFLAESSVEMQKITQTPGITTRDYLLLDSTPALQNSLVRKPVAENLGIERLTKSIAQEKLGKKLFSLPSDATLFARLEQFNAPPYFNGTYVQLVTDPAWNRVVYGDYQQSIKAYDGGLTEGKLNRPMGLDRDSRGYVYVADTGNNRVLVLQLAGTGNDLSLRYLTSFGEGELSQPYDVAWDDRATPFDTVDDLLWVVEQGNRRISGYRLQLSGVQKIVEFGGGDNGFVRPVSVAIGRFNGVSTGELYVSDAGRQRVTRLYFDGAALRQVGHYQGKAEAQFESVATDHWGSVFVTDRSLREIIKLNNRLEELTVLPAELENDLTPLRFEPVFASVALAQTGETLWSGYNQGFALEKWTPTSGGQRFELGIDVAKLTVKLNDALSEATISSRLTDAGELAMEIIDAGGRPVKNFNSVWALAGEQLQSWNRRDENELLVAPGYYRLRYAAASTYGTALARVESRDFYLPLFYYEDCGGAAQNDAHLAQGFRSRIGEKADHTVATDENKVVYRFEGLNPALEYELQAEFIAAGATVTQRLLADDRELLSAQNIEQAALAVQTEWLRLPAPVVSDGAVEVIVEKTGGAGPASISQLWLREANFDPNNPPAREVDAVTMPRAFELKQNYPNPFNPETTIEFSVPEGFSEVVELSIFNVLGQRVRTLVKGNLAAGKYAKVWNGTGDRGEKVASGVYFYKFSAGGFTQTRKLLLMK